MTLEQLQILAAIEYPIDDSMCKHRKAKRMKLREWWVAKQQKALNK